MILIGGYGSTFDPKKSTVINTIVSTAERYKKYYGKSPTHVNVPKETSKEDKRMIVSGLGLVIAGDSYGCNMVLVGVPTEEAMRASKKQVKG